MPRWAKFAFIAIWVACTVAFVIVLAFTGTIASFLTDHFSAAAVIVGGLLVFALILWVASRLEE